MRSISGIRGIVGDTLTPQILQSHVRAFLEITKAKRVVIGRDSRPTGDAIVQFVAGICRLMRASSLPQAITRSNGTLSSSSTTRDFSSVRMM